MKKFFKILFAVSFLGMTLTACNDLLEFSEDWTYDSATHWHACNDAGHEDAKDSIEAHTFDRGVVTPATFEADGYTTFTCTVCGYSYKDNYVHKLAHNYSTEWSVDTEKGTHYHACTDEGYTDLRANEEEHDYDLGVTTAPTYEEAGYTTYTCKVCGHKDVQPGDAQLEHHYAEEWSTSATKHWHACTDEGYETLISGEANHDFETTTIPATHETPEYEIHECKVCHYIETTEGGETVDHNYSDEWTYSTEKHWHACTDAGYSDLKKDVADHTFNHVVTEPTFETEGYTTHTCTVCGYSYVDDYKGIVPHSYSSAWSHDADTHWHACLDTGYSALKADESAHTWNAGVITVEPTETESGLKVYTCTVCGETKDEILPKTSHNYSSTWTNDTTHHWHACTDANCDAKDAYAEHEFNAGEYHEATYALDAYTLYTCTVCGYSYSESVANSRLSIQDETHLIFEVNDEGSGWVVKGGDSQLYADDADVYIPETHTEGNVTLPVVEIGEGAFAGGELERFVSGDNLEKISKTAFNSCAKLHTIELGKDVKTIQTNSFANCYRVTEIFNQSSLNIKVGATTFGGIARNAIAVVKTAEARGELNEVGNQHIYTDAAGKDYLAFYDNPNSAVDDVELDVDAIKPYAFVNCDKVEGVTIPAKTVEIGHHAFSNSGLTSVTVPATVTSIGEYAFENCDALAHATLANTTISNYQFKDCNVLAIDSAASITSIGMGAFEGSGLKAFDIPTGVTKINASTFAESGLESIEIPAQITSIEEGAFYGCESLEEITVASGNTHYSSTTGNDALLNFAGDEFIVVAAGVESADPAVAYEVPSDVTTIDSNAFYKSKLAKVSLPAGVTSIGATPFRLASNLTEISINGNENGTGSALAAEDGVLYSLGFAYLIAYPCNKANKQYTTNVDTYVIKDSAFEGAKNLESVFMGDTGTGKNHIADICSNAFADCTNLQAISMIANASGMRFGADCFRGVQAKMISYIGTNCNNFLFLTVNASNIHSAGIDTIVCLDVSDGKTSYLVWAESLDSYQEYKGTPLEAPLQDGVESIPEKAFYGSGLEVFTSPATLEHIGDSAFAGSANLKTINLNVTENDLTIDTQAFAATGVETLNINVAAGRTLTIGAQVFGNCSSLTNINIDNKGTINVGLQAFGNCSSITSFVVTGGSLELGDQALAGCSTLAYVVLPANFVLGQAPFYGCLVLSNLSEGECSLAGVPFTNPIFYMGDAASLQTCLAASAADQAYGGILLAADPNNPFGHLVTIKGFSVYAEEADAATIQYYADNYGLTLWHLVEGVPTVWTAPAP